MKGYQRKRVLIDGLQLRLLAFNLGYLFAYSVIVAALLLGPLILEVNTDGGQTVEKRQAAVQLLYLHARILPAFVFALCAFGIHGLFFSHRIAGPLYRFKQIFRSVQSGEVPVGVHLREKDLLQEEARSLGDMLTSLRTRLGDIHVHQEQLERGWGHLEQALQSGGADDIEQRLKELRSHIEDLGSRIARFDVGSIQPLNDVDERALEDVLPLRPSSQTKVPSEKT